MPEVCGSNQVNGKNFKWTVNCRKDENKQKENGSGPFSNNIGMRRVTTAISIAD